MKFIVLILALLLSGPGDGKKKGRLGNERYSKEDFAEAIRLFREGLSEIQEEGPGSLHSGLLNNLGASLFREENFEEALSAFSSSTRMATSVEDAVRASYNAGNAATMQQQLEPALEYYRQALLSAPDNEDAKFNYEFVKRRLKQQQDQQKNQDQQQQNQDQQKQNQDQQKQDQDQQQQDQSQNQDQQQEQNQNPQENKERPDPNELSQEEAQRILQALENDEEQLLRQVQKMKARPRRVEKDW